MPLGMPPFIIQQRCSWCLGLGVEIRLEKFRELVDRLFGSVALGAQNNLVAVASAESHKHKNRRCVDRRTANLFNRDLRGLLTRGLRENSGGAGMEPGSGRNLDGAFCHDVPFDEPVCHMDKHQRENFSEATLPNDAAGDLVGTLSCGPSSQPANLLEVRVKHRENIERRLRLR